MTETPQLDVTEETLTDIVVAGMANGRDARAREIATSLVRHLHAFVREVRLTPAEWMDGINFLTATGHLCDEKRQEFILLSDTLGVSMLVDAIANRKPSGATESTVLGPFFTDDAPELAMGSAISASGRGDSVAVSGHVRDTAGKPIAGAVMEVWETDGDGRYDVQYERREHPDCRGRFRTGLDGAYSFVAVKPVSYSIPTDGPVGTMLIALGRHTMRPAHLHVRISAPGYAGVTTAVYTDDDPYLASDAVFGVKRSLVGHYTRSAVAQETAGGASAPPYALVRDFVLVPA
jgi:protocatechuate 3,4-dioxygenase beta subunit